LISTTKSGKNQVNCSLSLVDLKRLHLYDGGLYDNLGLEEFVNVGTGIKKPYQDGLVIVSDAGKPIDQKFDKSVLNPLRAYDILAIPMDQTRALRVRDFLGHLRDKPGAGAHLRLGVSAEDIRKGDKGGRLVGLANLRWQDQATVNWVADVDTRLKGYKSEELQKIIQHGDEAARLSTVFSNPLFRE
jgi:NTE family protein